MSAGDSPSGEGDRGNARSGEMTLVFTLAAIQKFAEPATVFEEARAWSRYVGIVDNDAEAVAAFVEAHGVQPDFDPGDADKWLAMEEIRGLTDTPRHVFVGTSMEDRRIADQLAWEYRQVEEVADRADWALAREEDADGPVGRLLDRLFGQ
jgi:hypothetical protein